MPHAVIIHRRETDEEQKMTLDSDKCYHRTRRKKMEWKQMWDRKVILL